MTQSKYIRDLLHRTKMVETQSVPSPMITSSKLSKSGSDVFSDPTLYRSVIGAL